MENPQDNLFRYERKYLLKKINLNKFLAELFKTIIRKYIKKDLSIIFTMILITMIY